MPGEVPNARSGTVAFPVGLVNLDPCQYGHEVPKCQMNLPWSSCHGIFRPLLAGAGGAFTSMPSYVWYNAWKAPILRPWPF